jgi:hypothetical protein
MLNDTGSILQTVPQNDLVAMGANHQYQGYRPNVAIKTANEVVVRQSIRFEVQLLKADGTAASNWFAEEG